jgi:hypothetical protein
MNTALTDQQPIIRLSLRRVSLVFHRSTSA